MPIRVYSLHPAHGGFGMLDRSPDCVQFDDLANVEDYVAAVMEVNSTVEPIREGDEDYALIQDADGRIYDQDDGIVIGWMDQIGGYVTLELVYED